jgi:predicted DNA-binding transcriptional regulator AlpA
MSTRANPAMAQVAQERDRVQAQGQPRLLTPAEAAAWLGRAPATLANWRAAGTGPPHVKEGRLVRYRKSDLESWLLDQAQRHPRGPGPLLGSAKTPAAPIMTVQEFIRSMQDLYGDDFPCKIALLDVQSHVTVVPLLGIGLQEGPEPQCTLMLYGPHPEAAGQPAAAGATSLRQAGEPSERLTYLQRTLYGTPDLTHLLRVLNSPSEFECRPARRLVKAFLAHEQTSHLVEMVHDFFCAPVSNAIWLAHDDVRGLPRLTQTGGALYRWLHSKDPWRLKRCIECGKYFFDATKNGRKLHCSARCTTRHGTRTYRARLAG